MEDKKIDEFYMGLREDGSKGLPRSSLGGLAVKFDTVPEVIEWAKNQLANPAVIQVYVIKCIGSVQRENSPITYHMSTPKQKELPPVKRSGTPNEEYDF